MSEVSMCRCIWSFGRLGDDSGNDDDGSGGVDGGPISVVGWYDEDQMPPSKASNQADDECLLCCLCTLVSASVPTDIWAWTKKKCVREWNWKAVVRIFILVCVCVCVPMHKQIDPKQTMMS